MPCCPSPTSLPIAAACSCAIAKSMINIGVHDFEKRANSGCPDQRRPVHPAGAVDAEGTTRSMKWSTTTSCAPPSRKRMPQGHIHLQETLCDDVARAMLAHPKVPRCACRPRSRTSTRTATAVGVEVFHFKDAGRRSERGRRSPLAMLRLVAACPPSREAPNDPPSRLRASDKAARESTSCTSACAARSARRSATST